MFIHHYIEGSGSYIAAFQILGLDEQGPIREWCWETFGPPGLNLNTYPRRRRWEDLIKFGEIMFYSEADLALFLLRWR